MYPWISKRKTKKEEKKYIINYVVDAYKSPLLEYMKCLNMISVTRNGNLRGNIKGDSEKYTEKKERN